MEKLLLLNRIYHGIVAESVGIPIVNPASILNLTVIGYKTPGLAHICTRIFSWVRGAPINLDHLPCAHCSIIGTKFQTLAVDKSKWKNEQKKWKNWTNKVEKLKLKPVVLLLLLELLLLELLLELLLCDIIFMLFRIFITYLLISFYTFSYF